MPFENWLMASSCAVYIPLTVQAQNSSKLFLPPDLQKGVVIIPIITTPFLL
jgi:hypothetical protein